MLGSLAFGATGYSFVAAQNVTGTAPAGNATAPGNATSFGGATGANQTGGTTTATATGEINTFYARGRLADIISGASAGGAGTNMSAPGTENSTTGGSTSSPAGIEILGGIWKVDVIDGKTQTVEANMTMARPDGSGFHTHLLTNFTSGGANETAAASTTKANMTGGGNLTAPAGNATAPGGETATAQAVTLSQDRTFRISGTANIYTNGNLEWQNVPVTIENTGRVLTINVDHEKTDNHFGGQPIYGFVTALIGKVDDSKQPVLPPIESRAPAPTGTPMPTEPGSGIGGNMTAPAPGNAPAPAGNQTAPAPATNQTGGATGGGGATEVSITPGSSSKTTNAFDPNPVDVSVGGTVTWTNHDTTPHTVTSGSNGQPDGKFNSSPNLNPLLAPQQTFSHTFAEAGEFPYYCAIHPNMVGTVNVS